jgi:hypothetical protein
MTVVAPTIDVAGAALLVGIAAVQTLVSSGQNLVALPAMQLQLNALQMEAVDHFMATYWVSADSILAAMPPPTNSRYGPFVTAQLAAITARAAVVAALIARGPLPITMGNQAPQYSRSYPEPMAGYPLTLPDTRLYGLQMQLVDFCMALSILPAAQILSTMSGVQTYPFNGYVSNYTSYQYDIDG